MIKYSVQRVMSFIKHTEENEVGLHAAQAAFFTILSSVPFLMLLAVLIKHFTDIEIDRIISPVLRIFPDEISEYISDITREAIKRSESVAVVSAAIVSMLWSSSRGMMAIYCGLNNILGVRNRYNWIRTRLISFGYNIIVVMVVVVGVIAFLIGNMFFGFVFRFKFLWFFLILVTVFAAIYAFLPRNKSRYISQLPGAVASAVGWLVFSYLFSLYTKYFSRFPLLYGSLTALALLMLWVYFCQYMFLLGAQINESIHTYFRNVKKL